MSALTHNRFWRTMTLLARIDIATNLSIATALCIWMVLH
jgi:hypothetical protein